MLPTAHTCQHPPAHRLALGAAPQQPGTRRPTARAAAPPAEQAETYLGEKFQKVPGNGQVAPSGKVPGLRLKEQDHCAVEVCDLEKMTRWYTEVLGCKQLPRPPFPFGGAWLQAGSNLVIHLIQQDPSVPRKVPTGSEAWKERYSGEPEPWYIRRSFHNAFAVASLDEAKETLQALGIPHNVFPVPGTDGVEQIFLHDPEGNGIEIGAGYEQIKASVGL